MAGNVTKRRRKQILECPLLDAARTPLPPRVLCCVFGCRSSDRDAVSFHHLPQEPERLNLWLHLINRSDLLDKLSSGKCEMVCSAHFPPEQTPGGVLAPDAVPCLLLPTTSHQFVSDASSALLQVKPEIEIKEETEENIEIHFEQEVNQTTGPKHPLDPPDPLGTQMRSCETQISEPINQIPSLDWRDLLPLQSMLVMPQILFMPPVKPEPKYSDYQVHSEAQTNVTEAFYRIATFSAVEQINIPTEGTKLKDVPTSSAYVQTTPDLLEFLCNDVRRRFGMEIEEAKKKLLELERPHMEKQQFLKSCDSYLEKKLSNFIKSHAFFSDESAGRACPMEFKEFALKLYLFNPKSYRFVEKFLGLPSKSSIERFKMPMRSGVNQSLMEALKTKVEQMSSLGKMCAVSFDVMSLKKNLYYDIGYDYLCGIQEIDGVVGQETAKYAAVISVRGIYSKWRQPVAFALVVKKKKQPELQMWLHKTISALFNIGLNVKVLVNNYSNEFFDASIISPYVEISARKVYQIYDVPNLLKCARDELRQYDFDIDGNVARWTDIVTAYDIDKGRELRLMPDITEKHVKFNATQKNDVKLATQLFSRSVSAALHFHVVAGFQGGEASETVRFISKMSSILDFFNSRKLADAYRATASQERFLNDTLKYLEAIQLKDMYGNEVESKFVTGLTTNINTLKSLIADLKKSNVNYLLTKNLSNVYMQSYFDEIRRMCGLRTTPILFTRAFRRLYLKNLLNNTKTTVTGEDINLILAKIAEYVDENIDKPNLPSRTTSMSIDVNDYKADWPSNEYIAGYILSKCIDRHCCDKMVQTWCLYYRFEPQSKAALVEAFQFYNAENVNRLCKIRPPTQFRLFVNILENKYNEYFISNSVQNFDFGWNLYCIMEKESCALPCTCFPIKFFKMLYIRLKIYNTVKMYKDYDEIIIEEE